MADLGVILWDITVISGFISWWSHSCRWNLFFVYVFTLDLKVIPWLLWGPGMLLWKHRSIPSSLGWVVSGFSKPPKLCSLQGAYLLMPLADSHPWIKPEISSLDIRKEGIFRSDRQKVVREGSKFGPPGPKNGNFWPFFWPFSQFFGLWIFSSEWIFLII